MTDFKTPEEVQVALDDLREGANFLRNHFPTRPFINGQVSPVDYRLLDGVARDMDAALSALTQSQARIAEQDAELAAIAEHLPAFEGSEDAALPQRAAIAAQTLKGLSGVMEANGSKTRRIAELEGALRPLLEACEHEFIGNVDMSDEPDDEPVMAGLDEHDRPTTCAITFGLLRKARALLNSDGESK